MRRREKEMSYLVEAQLLGSFQTKGEFAKTLILNDVDDDPAGLRILDEVKEYALFDILPTTNPPAGTEEHVRRAIEIEMVTVCERPLAFYSDRYDQVSGHLDEKSFVPVECAEIAVALEEGWMLLALDPKFLEAEATLKENGVLPELKVKIIKLYSDCTKPA
jgi:hypothetical protein